MALALSIDSDAFIQLWADTSTDRIKGIMKNCRENFEYVCRRVGSPISDAKIELASKIRLEMIQSEMVLRVDAVEVLSTLKSEGYKVGLVSNCTYEASIVWESTPFPPLVDITVFSCLVGLKKPDPRIYQIAMQQLGVKAQNCLYVGDGDSHELSGAAAVGMHPVLIRDPEQDDSTVYRVEPEVDRWTGPVITSLKEICELLK